MARINMKNVDIGNCNVCTGNCDSTLPPSTVLPTSPFYMFVNNSLPQLLSTPNGDSPMLILDNFQLNNQLQLWTPFLVGNNTYTFVNNSTSSRFIATQNNMPNSPVILAPNTDNPNNRWMPDISFGIGVLYILRLQNVVNNEYFIVDTSCRRPVFRTTANRSDATVFTLVGIPFINLLELS